MRSYWGLLLIVLLFACQDENPKEDIIEEPEPEVCDQSTCWDETVYVCRDQSYIKLFTRSTGWTGGDATYSVDLKNGKTLWMFGDTFIDQINPDRSRPSFRLIRNSVVLQDGDEMITYHGGTSLNPTDYARPPETNDWYWPGDATVANGKLYMFMHGFGNDTGGAWDFYRTSVDLLTINLQTLAIERNDRLFEDPVISWGAAILEDTDFTYVYGVRSDASGKSLYVARTNADMSADWQYFTGTEWSSDKEDAESIHDDVSEQFAVFKDGSTYYLLSQNNFFGKQIYLFNATSPEGVFGDMKVVYCTPETGGDIYTYNAFAHPHIYADSLLVSYNVNSFDYTDLLANADNYRPYFIRVGDWRKK